MAIVLRNVKGSPLTHIEMDNNLDELDTRLNSVENDFVLSDLSNVDTTGAINGSVLKYDGTNWVIGTDNFYTNSDVDNHFNTGTASEDQILSWNGTDYTWIDNSARGFTYNEDDILGTSEIGVTADVFDFGDGKTIDMQNSSILFTGSTISGLFDQDLNTTDSVTFNGITSTSANIFSGGTTVFNTSSTLSYPSYSSPLSISNTGGDTIAFQMNVVGNNLHFINDNGTLRIKSNVTEVFSVNDSGTVTATSFVGDGSSLTGIPAGYTDSDVDTHINTGTASSAQVLSWNGTDYAWVNQTSVGTAAINDLADVDTSGAVNGSVLKYDGSNWVVGSDNLYTDGDVDTHLNTGAASSGQYLGWNGADYVWSTVSGYTDGEVDTHLNTSTASSSQVLSWNGTDYDWVDQTLAGTSTVVAPFAFVRLATTSNGSGTGISWSNWDAVNGTMDFTFDNAQPDTNYIVVTDGEANDDGRLVSIQNKTVNGFEASFYDTNGIRTPSAADAYALIVYGSTPTTTVVGSGSLTDLSVTTNAAGTAALTYNNTSGVFAYTPPDLSGYLTSETNDLTASVTWANVPDANITQSSVTQHQAALSITESQISDLSHYTNSDVDAHLNTGTASSAQVLSWNGTDYAWVNQTSVGTAAINDLSDVNTSGAVNGSVLKYDGSNWVIGTDNTGSAGITISDVADNVNYNVTFTNETSGTQTASYIDDTAFTYNPSTGTVNAFIFNSTSDIKLKDNVETIDNPIEKVMNLRGVNFDWKHSSEKSIGVIAQEIEKIIPEAVADNNDVKSVNYDGLVGLLIEAIKEQQKEINELKKKIQ